MLHGCLSLLCIVAPGLSLLLERPKVDFLHSGLLLADSRQENKGRFNLCLYNLLSEKVARDKVFWTLPAMFGDRLVGKHTHGLQRLCIVTHLQYQSKDISHGCRAWCVNLDRFHGVSFRDQVRMNGDHCSPPNLLMWSSIYRQQKESPVWGQW